MACHSPRFDLSLLNSGLELVVLGKASIQETFLPLFDYELLIILRCMLSYMIVLSYWSIVILY